MVCEWRVSWCASVMSCIVYHGVCECRIMCASVNVMYHVCDGVHGVMSCIMVCECDVVYHGVRVMSCIIV